MKANFLSVPLHQSKPKPDPNGPSVGARTLRFAYSFGVRNWAMAVMAVMAFSSRASGAPGEELRLTGLAGWRQPTGEWVTARSVSLDPVKAERMGFEPGQGLLVNGSLGKTVDLLTEAEFGDVEVHVEFCISRHSNSGVYLMGRYEIQIYDSQGVTKDKYPGIECGGIYPRWTPERNEFEGHSPRVNVSKSPGQWQSFDIIFRAPRFDAAGKKLANARFERVWHNGELVHENVEVTGPTRAAHWEVEAKTGPLLIQGDHGPVAIRNLKLKPLGQ